MVFQDSASSLNPRMPVRDSVAFGPLVLAADAGGQAAAEADEALRRVGLDPERCSGHAIRTSFPAVRSSG